MNNIFGRTLSGELLTTYCRASDEFIKHEQTPAVPKYKGNSGFYRSVQEDCTCDLAYVPGVLEEGTR